MLLYFLDAVVSALVVPLVGMLSWRSVWNVMDGLIYPDDYLKSNVVCTVFGYSTLCLVFICQTWLADVSLKLSNKSR